MLLLIFCPLVKNAQVPVEELKKDAAKLYEEEAYPQAYKLYSQLVANFPKDPEYNYRLGVCMIYAEPDKKKSIPFLKAAAANPTDAPKDVNFYLGKAYHINYLFDEAIKYYNAFKKTAPASLQKKLQVDREIKACSNGKRLLSNLTDLVVQSKKSLNEADYFRSYDLKTIGGKLLVKPDEFKTGTDKKKKERSVVFLPKNSDVVYFSSYGENADNGKDIYTAARIPGGGFTRPEKLKGINTEFDEDFPFLHPDGKTLYFASKGYNSMGGYDIFKTTFNEETGAWSQPQNLEFPINSPDDDYLYVTDSLEKTAYFSTGRQSPPGKIDVLKINTERRPIDILAITGNVLKGSEAQSQLSVISIKDLTKDRPLGTFEATEEGEYALELPNGSKLLYTVETPGFKTQSKEVEMPLVTASRPYQQTISYEDGILKINQFESSNDSSYLQYLKVIEKKAKLDVNEGQNQLSTPPATVATPTVEPQIVAVETPTLAPPKKETRPEIITEEPGGAITTTNPTPTAEAKPVLNNTELAKMAWQDAEESAQEAQQMKRDARDAYELGSKQKDEAGKKLAEAEEAIKSAETISSEEEKNNVLGKANSLKRSAEGDLVVAEKIISYAQSLEKDAQARQKDAELNKQYAFELEKNAQAKDKKAALARIENLQSQISSNTPPKKESENIINGIKSDIEQKEAQVTKVEKAGTDIRSNIGEIKTEIANKEAELEKTRKKAAKEEINRQIDELKADQAGKEKQVTDTDTELAKLNDELSVLKSELDLTTRIKTEEIAANPPATTTAATPTPGAANEPATITNVAASEKVTAASLSEKYKGQVAVTDPGNKTALQQSSDQLRSFNAEVDKALAANKAQLARTKSQQAKQKFTAEIKELESLKRKNQQQIAANTTRLQDLDRPNAAQNNAAVSAAATYSPITAASGQEAAAKLDKLDKQLTFNDNDNFDFNGYGNREAQALKLEADAKINDAVARQKKLKDEIAASRTAIADLKQAAPAATTLSGANAEQLNKDAEDLHQQAVNKLNESKTKEGAEKEQLVNQSRELEEQSNGKNLEVAALTQRDNNAAFEAQRQNIEGMLGEKKASQPDQDEARRMGEEAALAYKQAQDIRSEASLQTNNGAKLGSLSNAEEKEAEALLKAQQAVDLLKKSSPGYALKTPAPTAASEPAAATASTADLGAKLEAVNNGLNELANLKIESYQKLSDANTSEATELDAGIKSRQAALDANPGLKTEYIAAGNKLEAARALRQKANDAASPGEKLDNLVASIKKQNEAVKQLNALNSSLGKTTPPAEPVVTSNTVAATPEPPAVITETIAADPVTENTVAATTSTPPASEGNTTAGANAAPGNTAQATASSALSEVAASDTSSSQVLTYFKDNSPTLKNKQADNILKKTLGQLSTYENEISAIDEKLNKPAEPGTSSTESTGASAAELKTRSETMMVEADEISTKAQQARKEAEGKEGAEKEALMTNVKELEEQALDKNIEAAVMQFKANEIDVASNAAAIDDLLNKLRSDNPETAATLSTRKEELNNLKGQAIKLRAEAETQENKAAKLGAINNAEERELELVQKQEQLIAELKRQYPDYVVKQLKASDVENAPAESRESLLSRKEQVRSKQFTGLTDLTNAFSLEFESTKNGVPVKLDAEQQKTKQKAFDMNAESKRLLISSAKEKDEAKKMKLLTRAARLGGQANAELGKILPVNTVVANNRSEPETTGNPLKENNDPTLPKTGTTKTKTKNETANSEPVVKADPATTTKPGPGGKNQLRIDGLEVRQGNAYTEVRPIPINAKVEDGLVFRVQIGAFRTQLPNDAFRGLNPLNGETTSNGYFRYTAGNFNRIENANAVKNDLRDLGYTDAFVVAYYNGKRVSLAEALELMSKEGRTIDANAPKTAGITANINVPKAAANPVAAAAVASRELEKVNGLLYTIQIGVYNKQVNAAQLRGLRPIFTEQLPGGLFRYTAGIYNDADRLISDKRKLVEMGIKDAFVSAYLNGKKIAFADAKTRQQTDASIKMEAQDPVIFPTGDLLFPSAPQTTAPNNASTNNTPASTPAVQPFSNGVSSYPATTPDNGVKQTEEGICYKVQVGAYTKQVPADIASKLQALKTWPVENKQVNGLFIYNIGNFAELRYAKALKDEAIRLGLNDAFITVYKDGRKLYGADAASYINPR